MGCVVNVFIVFPCINVEFAGGNEANEFFRFLGDCPPECCDTGVKVVKINMLDDSLVEKF